MASGPHPGGACLEVRDLELWRGRRCLLSSFAFSVGGGQLARLTGPNGSGKTTLLRALAGLTQAETGQIAWCGKPISDPAFRGASAYIGHHNAVTADLSARENLRYAACLAGGATGAGLDQALERVGLTHTGERPAATLSAGQQRRLALARLLMAPAWLWLLDEPLTSLDRAGVALVETLLDEHLGRGGVAVVTTHQPLQAGAHHVVELQLRATA